MNPKLRSEIPLHMRNFGVRVLSMANYHAHIGNLSGYGGFAELAVVEAAHAAEIFVKARIAEEHPMLIFDRLPNLQRSPTLEDLLDAQTVSYNDLPGLLLATTGIHLAGGTQFRDFGRFRNRVQHFLPPPTADLRNATLRFIYGVLDPFVHQCWGMFAVDYNEDEPPYDYLVDALVEREIVFLVSAKCARAWPS